MRSNYRAARKGRSRAEFIAKLGLALEEADESLDCLEVLRDGNIAYDPNLLSEARQLTAILTKSQKTARENDARQRNEKPKQTGPPKHPDR